MIRCNRSIALYQFKMLEGKIAYSLRKLLNAVSTSFYIGMTDKKRYLRVAVTGIGIEGATVTEPISKSDSCGDLYLIAVVTGSSI